LVVRKTGSTAIAADRAHYLSDVAVNLVVLAALGITTLTRWEYADPLFAIAIAGYMLWNSRGIALTALRQLLDSELETEKRLASPRSCLPVPASGQFTICARAMPAIASLSSFTWRSTARFQ
jgi:divalent metal cation (Fe/Co/Zn/Cd) transporter